MKRLAILLSLILFCAAPALAQSSDECETECEVPYSCQTLIECRVTKMRCLDSCRQRNAWIKLTQAVEKFTFSLAKHLEELSEKFDSLQEQLSTRDSQHSRQIADVSRKIEALQEHLMPSESEEPADQDQSQ